MRDCRSKNKVVRQLNVLSNRYLEVRDKDEQEVIIPITPLETVYDDDVPVGPNSLASKGIESLKGRLYEDDYPQLDEDKENILLRLETLYLTLHSKLLLRVGTPYPTKLRREEVNAYLTFFEFLLEGPTKRPTKDTQY